MASASNILPEETGPPRASQLIQKQTKNDSTQRSNSNNINKITKSTLWGTSNKIFRANNKKPIVLDNFSGTEISSNFLYNCGESRQNGGDLNENNTKLCQFIEEEDNFNLKKTRVDQKVDFNENYVADTRSSKKRFLYQDVDEALNSLLWQPYEYQNKSNEEYFSLSSFDSCCSLSSFDLENDPNEEVERADNSADLHLDDVAMMVNNLEGNLNRLNQSRAYFGSRELLTGSPPSRLLSNVSGNESVGRRGSCCFVPCDEFKNSAPTEMSTHPGCLTSNNIITTTAVNRNVDAVAKTTVSVVNLNQNSTADGTGSGNGSSSNLNLQQRRPTEPNKRQRSNISSDASNLNSINVVGLPNHPRHASIPSTSSSNRNSNTGKGFIFPNHPRNSSEPSTVIQQPAIAANHNRNSSTPVVTNNHIRNVFVPTTPIRNSVPPTNVTINQTNSNSTTSTSSSTNISCANIVSILSHHRHSSQDIPNYMPTSLRSASVPKSLTQNIAGESSTTTLNITNQQSRIPINVTAVDVNFYRAVPVTVVSNVPTIQCINNVASETGNSVSNVNIVQAMPPTSTSLIPIVSSSNVSVQQTEQQVQEVPTTRTFISTEAQTDDLVGSTLIPNSERAFNREQRRRERRERRHMQRLNNGSHQHVGGSTTRERLPDLLSNHMPPPYTSNNISVPNSSLPGPIVPNLVVPSGVVGNQVVPNGVVSNHVVVPFSSGQLPLVQAAPVAVAVSSPSGCRFPFPTAGFRRSRYSEEHPKSCCGLLAWKPGSLRWFIALIAVVAVCCVLVGTALGAMRPAGRDHLTVSLLMIGVGIVLVTVSGVAWRLTSHDTSTCRAMLGLGSTESVDVCPRRFVPRLPPTYGRPHHPYAAMIYPEFQYRPPPPTYQASMQEYRLRLLLLDRGNTPQIQNGVQNGPSPPPTYRSYAGSLLRGPLSRRDATQSEYSFPPSYRSHSSTRPGTMDLQTSAIIHSRDHSLSISESNHGDSTINNVNLDNITIDSLKLTPENDINQVNVLLKGGSCSDLENNSKDANLVTIVQTNDQNPVIVTVSGCSQSDLGNNIRITEVPSEMEILAHL